MTQGNRESPPVEPLRASLNDADDRLRLDHWLRPQPGIAPHIRIGRRWINALWGLPIAAAALLCVIAVAQSSRSGGAPARTYGRTVVAE
jgi:sulfoxide reductase catalytic subunit YedY